MGLRVLLSCFLFFAVVFSCFAQEKTDSFTVFGNCGMCKSRIEKAARIKGVSSVNWNKSTKVFTVTYDDSVVSNETIQKKIAAVGHDTELFEAPDKVYEKLHACFLYERKRELEKQKNP